MTINNQTKEFLRKLFGWVIGKDYYLEIRLLTKDQKSKDALKYAGLRAQSFFSLKDPNVLERVVEYLKELRETQEEFWKKGLRFNIYFGFHPRKEPKGKTGAVVECKFLAIDCDLRNPETGKRDPSLKKKITPEMIVRALGLEPTIITDTGGGYQFYFELEEPIRADDYEILEKALIKYAQERVPYKECEIDPSISDRPRVLRVPGALNMKEDYAEPLETRVIKITEKKYSPSEIQAFLSKYIEQLKDSFAKTTYREDIQSTSIKHFNKFEIHEWQKEKLKDVLKKYYVKGYRHNILLGLAGYLLKNGYKYTAIRTLIQELTEEFNDEESRVRISETIDDIYKRVNEIDEDLLEKAIRNAKKLGVSDEKIKDYLQTEDSKRELILKYGIAGLHHILSALREGSPKAEKDFSEGEIETFINSIRSIFKPKKVLKKTLKKALYPYKKLIEKEENLLVIELLFYHVLALLRASGFAKKTIRKALKWTFKGKYNSDWDNEIKYFTQLPTFVAKRIADRSANYLTIYYNNDLQIKRFLKAIDKRVNRLKEARELFEMKAIIPLKFSTSGEQREAEFDIKKGKIWIVLYRLKPPEDKKITKIIEQTLKAALKNSRIELEDMFEDDTVFTSFLVAVRNAVQRAIIRTLREKQQFSVVVQEEILATVPSTINIKNKEQLIDYLASLETIHQYIVSVQKTLLKHINLGIPFVERTVVDKVNLLGEEEKLKIEKIIRINNPEDTTFIQFRDTDGTIKAKEINEFLKFLINVVGISITTDKSAAWLKSLFINLPSSFKTLIDTSKIGIYYDVNIHQLVYRMPDTCPEYFYVIQNYGVGKIIERYFREKKFLSFTDVRKLIYEYLETFPENYTETKRNFTITLAYLLASHYYHLIRKYYRIFPILILDGEKGAGKSTYTEFLARIIYGIDLVNTETDKYTEAQLRNLFAIEATPIIFDQIDPEKVDKNYIQRLFDYGFAITEPESGRLFRLSSQTSRVQAKFVFSRTGIIYIGNTIEENYLRKVEDTKGYRERVILLHHSNKLRAHKDKIKKWKEIKIISDDYTGVRAIYEELAKLKNVEQVIKEIDEYLMDIIPYDPSRVDIPTRALRKYSVIFFGFLLIKALFDFPSEQLAQYFKELIVEDLQSKILDDYIIEIIVGAVKERINQGEFGDKIKIQTPNDSIIKRIPRKEGDYKYLKEYGAIFIPIEYVTHILSRKYRKEASLEIIARKLGDYFNTDTHEVFLHKGRDRRKAAYLRIPLNKLIEFLIDVGEEELAENLIKNIGDDELAEKLDQILKHYEGHLVYLDSALDIKKIAQLIDTLSKKLREEPQVSAQPKKEERKKAPQRKKEEKIEQEKPKTERKPETEKPKVTQPEKSVEIQSNQLVAETDITPEFEEAIIEQLREILKAYREAGKRPTFEEVYEEFKDIVDRETLKKILDRHGYTNQIQY